MNYDFNETMSFMPLISSLLSFNAQDHIDNIRNVLQAKERNIFLFNYGRNALRRIIEKTSNKGDRLIFPAFICPWLVEEATKMLRTPVLVDVSLDTFNIDLRKLAEEQKDAKIVFVVHNFGSPVEIDQIRKICQTHLVEDMAHSMFASLDGVKLGTFGDSILYSMYKQVPNFHGSFLVTNLDIEQPKLTESLSLDQMKKLIIRIEGPHQFIINTKRKRSHSSYSHQTYDVKSPSRIAIALFSKLLKRAEMRTGGKQRVAEMYYSQVKKSDKFKPQMIIDGARPSWFSFNVKLNEEISEFRDLIVSELRRCGIFCDRQWFDAPVGSFTIPGSIVNSCNNAVTLSKTIINLPLKDYYTLDNVDYVLNNLREVIEKICKN